ncbi:hypothetical protein ACR30L_19760 [Psychromonas sp. PT13]|uniref:hypothetical protein n=1 Tax=Psychromonas sp. PT13 TaxID=3439547 RepID=UPI003EBC6275
MKKIIESLIFASLLVTSHFAISGEIENALSEGVESYKAGDLSSALSQLDHATLLIRQKKSEQIIAAFPKPLSGWQENNEDSDVSQLGINISKSYSMKSSRITIEIFSNSPAMVEVYQGMMDPKLVAIYGAKVVDIQGNKAVYSPFGGDEINIMMVLNNMSVIMIKGPANVEKDILKYAQSINFSVL